MYDLDIVTPVRYASVLPIDYTSSKEGVLKALEYEKELGISTTTVRKYNISLGYLVDGFLVHDGVPYIFSQLNSTVVERLYGTLHREASPTLVRRARNFRRIHVSSKHVTRLPIYVTVYDVDIDNDTHTYIYVQHLRSIYVNVDMVDINKLCNIFTGSQRENVLLVRNVAEKVIDML